MRIAVLSGKGGTGKTFLSVNMAAAATCATYYDCDVEEPNGHLFFQPENIQQQEISILLPRLDASLCSGCRQCVDFCRFNALAFIQNKPVIFPDICHSCGGCLLVCPSGALQQDKKTIGTLQTGTSGQVKVVSGFLNPGQPSGVSLISAVLQEGIQNNGLEIVDCPPGSACVVMESIQSADFCLLVAEPTVFGAHNLAMVHQLATLFQKPCGVVLNKVTGEDNPSQDFCLRMGVDILMEIPYSETIASMLAQGQLVSRKDEEWKSQFRLLLQGIEKRAGV